LRDDITLAIPSSVTSARSQRMTTATSQTAATQLIDVQGTSFAYREFGAPSEIPLVFLHHLTATLDDWDPALLDGIAATRHVIIFDNRGVGRSGGVTPDSVDAMARDTAAFLDARARSRWTCSGFRWAASSRSG
jgi:pimeloyl-ACP methyl ester carboxylesterase